MTDNELNEFDVKIISVTPPTEQEVRSSNSLYKIVDPL